MSREGNSPADGALYLVATPIGNLEDMTIRALNTLKECDVIYAEDTRRTRILLDKFEIHKKLESYHIFNEHGKASLIIGRVLAGEKAALVTDAGMPCIADPGFLLVREAVKAGIEPVIVPGVSSLTFTVAASALPSDRFAFYGFLPVKSGRRSAAIKEIASEGKSVVIFESPYRVAKLLKELASVMGEDTLCAVVREATKVHEEVLRGTLGEVIEQTKERNWKGECIVMVGPSSGADGLENTFLNGEEEE
ncbi:MAG: 16S rRNA (cytidine(1402)-2'-O)-methyltransferase [Lentisphaeria bacterium]|nr:16S rRNA (cytidine(1402)-2'-O)-methyltransferase [Lentisphaeria bacterium]